MRFSAPRAALLIRIDYLHDFRPIRPEIIVILAAYVPPRSSHAFSATALLWASSRAA